MSAETDEFYRLRPWARPGGGDIDDWLPLTDEQRRTMEQDIEAAKPAVEPDDGQIVYSCGPPGHDYSDHIVDYQGKAILDINLPEGEKGSPITGPSWTEVDPEIWSDEYRER